MAYSVIAGAVGAAVRASARRSALVLRLLQIAGGFDRSSRRTSRCARSSSATASASSVTFITVVIASMKVSARQHRLRDPRHGRGRQAPGPRARRAGVGAGRRPGDDHPAARYLVLLRKGFGVAWAWIIAPAGVLVAALVDRSAPSRRARSSCSGSAFSMIPLCVAMLASLLPGAGPRRRGPLVGVYLAAYWLSPIKHRRAPARRKLNGDIEMFVMSRRHGRDRASRW